MNIVFTLRSYDKLFLGIPLQTKINYINIFIDEQLYKFREWCDIGTDMWNDEPEEAYYCIKDETPKSSC